MLVLFLLLSVVLGDHSPVPQRALPVCQNCSTKGYDVVPVGAGVWAFTDGGYWAMAVLNAEQESRRDYSGQIRAFDEYGARRKELSFTIVDAWEGPGYLKAIQDLLAWTGATTVKTLIYSHAHTDHIGSAGALKNAFPKLKIIAHEETRKTLLRVTDSRRPVPDITLRDRLRVPEAGLVLAYHGPSHSQGDLTIYHPESKTLMFIDVVFPRWVPFWNMAISQDLPGYYEMEKTLLDYDFKTFIGGHLTRLGDRADVEEFYDYINDVKATAKKILPTLNFGAFGASVGAFDPTHRNYGNLWLTFDTMLDQGATQCATEIIGRWQEKLGGTDVWSYAQCWALIEALRVDFA